MNKNREIERKFLIKEIPIDLTKYGYLDIVQGYKNGTLDEKYVYRVRQVLYFNEQGIFEKIKYLQTIKGISPKDRAEYEIEISNDAFHTMWDFCDKSLDKKRYELKTRELTNTKGIRTRYVLDLDIYKHELSGLKVAEVEFDTVEDCDAYTPETWFGEEITNDTEYSNYSLSKPNKK
jgi:CYTH domain-containing protein